MGPVIEADVLVAGGGMAGLAAALAAREAGATTMLLEASDRVGGAARFSSGRIWTLPDHDAFRRRVPLGDSMLQRVLARGLTPALDWLAGGVGHLATQPDDKEGRGRVMTLGATGERGPWLSALAAAASRAGAEIRTGSRIVAVETLDDVFLVRTALGGTAVKARALVLATGGYQGDRALLRSHLGAEADRLMLRSTVENVGDGFQIGLALGGLVSRGMSGFYGKTMPRHAEGVAPERYKNLTVHVARAAIAVNREGDRFVDETGGLSGEALAAAGVYQPGGDYFILCAGTQAAEVQRDAYAAVAAERGLPTTAILIEAASADELAAAMERHWGVPATRVLATVADVRDAARAADGMRLSPPRAVPPKTFDAPPYLAVASIPSITIPYGGLAVDAAFRLRSAGGGVVRGAFAAGADAGGVYLGAYAGGLAWALVGGWTAGRNAAAAAIESRGDAAPAPSDDGRVLRIVRA